MGGEKWDFIYKWGFGRRVNGHDEADAAAALAVGREAVGGGGESIKELLLLRWH